MHGRVPGIRFSDCCIIRYLFKSTDTDDNRGGGGGGGGCRLRHAGTGLPVDGERSSCWMLFQ